ncbi:hypothetical protein OJAV_G00035560 [Oryzias javanicus]|uniref:Uncharacterized protein n=1 Tax=Oryzias javanicus TaxID=123683 RepID=A0A437DFV1_ORYJA|nr:hypothetical protein OJAV_G00035560 [Oryzias javanicus]
MAAPRQPPGVLMRRGDAVWSELQQPVVEMLTRTQNLQQDLGSVDQGGSVLLTWSNFDTCRAAVEQLGGVAAQMSGVERLFSPSTSVGGPDCQPTVTQSLRFIRAQVEGTAPTSPPEGRSCSAWFLSCPTIDLVSPPSSLLSWRPTSTRCCAPTVLLLLQEEVQGSDGQLGCQHVLRLAKALVEIRSLPAIPNSRVARIVALWEGPPESDNKQGVVYPARHRDRQPKGCFKAAKGKSTSCPGKESLQRGLLGLNAGVGTTYARPARTARGLAHG